ncbi:LOW QUALITY PROTEIN: hypothetical protein HID58_007910 [Brassica napus]|uniref:Uncharacterized protein n=1 Tax=Brassica napus TaxID=3708 RepID=A0ABQ7XJJ1_BRANA|nr:LOW QUALITY PROTEIN: hypothetical protein HID58_007910 [Brassica napus]
MDKWRFDSVLYLNIVAFLCTVGAIALAIFHIYRHLLNYTEPTYQRYIVRIVFMVPVYAFMSFLSLVLPRSSIYFDSIREVLGDLQLPIPVFGLGWRSRSSSAQLKRPLFTTIMVSHDLLLSSLNTRRAFYSEMQARLSAIRNPEAYPGGCHTSALREREVQGRNFNPDQAYLYLPSSTHISYTVALYALVLFYMACRDLLQPFNPVPKFVIIKSVVFLTYWQEYAGANVGGSRSFSGSLTHAVKLNDFYHDTVHQFAPTYHDYVLYNHNEGGEGDKEVPVENLCANWPRDGCNEKEQTSVCKQDRWCFGFNLSSNASSPKSSSVTSDPVRSEAVKSSLLVDASDSLDTMYDMTLIDIDISSFPSNVPSANESGPR